MAGMSVGPYQDITFDKDGDVDRAQRDRLLGMEVTDLVMFAHGWNNSPSVAGRLYSAFFAPFPELLGEGVRLGYAGVVWPSMKFTDEPIPDFAPRAAGAVPPAGPRTGPDGSRDAGRDAPESAADGSRAAPGSAPEGLPVSSASPVQVPVPPRSASASPSASPSAEAGFGDGARGGPDDPDIALDTETRLALNALFPGHGETVERLARLLDERPESPEAFAEFGRLARRLAEAPAGGLETSCFTDDLPDDEQGPPAVLFEDAFTMCRRFTRALEGSPEATVAGGEAAPEAIPVPGALKKTWKGAKELLRQTTYYAMKRRAGTVGELGLGPLLGQLARSRPAMRVHLVGHSQGARLVAFALRGLPDGARNVKSVTLLQGAFSHYAFSPSLPHAPGHAGALRSLEQRVDGPVVACYSRHDSALGTIYPMASSLARDDRAFTVPIRPDKRWWAIGHDGFQAVRPSARLDLDEVLAHGVPAAGCVSVDAASVVRRGGPPSGAHSDICHRELAQVVVSAGRIGR
ncbi:serine-threonine protein kinase [Streptomyces sp. NPDC051018]|uniref:serine-threonine protein kinase n=1 Tax=Streptomyces sp. NPDC051018 TaxID=3365639 RepID=UPI0037902AC1